MHYEDEDEGVLILSCENSCGGMLERMEHEEISGTQRQLAGLHCVGTSISQLSQNIKIAQALHHCTHPVENVIESHEILALISCWLDLSGYDGSSVGCQWDYSITQLPDQYCFLDVWDHF